MAFSPESLHSDCVHRTFWSLATCWHTGRSGDAVHHNQFVVLKINFWNGFDEFLARISHNFLFKGVEEREFTLLRRRKEYKALVKLGSFKGRERSDTLVSFVLKYI